jgi:hypothetical protein
MSETAGSVNDIIGTKKELAARNKTGTVAFLVAVIAG